MSNEEPDKRPHSIFVRVLIAMLGLLLATMIVYRYFFLDPRGEITYGLLVLIFFLVILVLSESFDNFSFGTLLAVTRQLRTREAENTVLKQEVSDLRGHLVTVATSVSQNQSSTNVISLSDVLARSVTVQPAAADDIEEKRALEEPPKDMGISTAREVPNWGVAIDNARKKVLAANGWNQYPAIYDAKITSVLPVSDPFMTSAAIFDCYIVTPDLDVFVMLVPAFVARGGVLRANLYRWLSILDRYRTTKNKNVLLALGIIRTPNDELKEASLHRLEELYSPAITNRFLTVVEVTLTREEAGMPSP